MTLYGTPHYGRQEDIAQEKNKKRLMYYTIEAYFC